LENVSVHCGRANLYCSHFLENRIDKVMSTDIPGEVWRPTSAQQVQHLSLVEETGNQGDFIGRAYRRSSKNVRGKDQLAKDFPKYGAPGSILSERKWWPLPAYVMMSSHSSHNERSPFQISLQYLHWC